MKHLDLDAAPTVSNTLPKRLKMQVVADDDGNVALQGQNHMETLHFYAL